MTTLSITFPDTFTEDEIVSGLQWVATQIGEGYTSGHVSSDEHWDYSDGAPAQTADCQYCDRVVLWQDGRWIDPEATGDDSVWRETCDSNDTFEAPHEPE